MSMAERHLTSKIIVWEPLVGVVGRKTLFDMQFNLCVQNPGSHYSLGLNWDHVENMPFPEAWKLHEELRRRNETVKA
jgi:hypothetical protein